MKNIALLLQESSSLLKREFERTARPHNLTLTQWRVLGELARSGAKKQVELGGLINASPMTVSDVAERLDAAGFIRRETDPEDSRAKLLLLTDKGNQMVEVMRELAAEVFAKAMAGIPPQDIDTLTHALTRITENLEDH